MSENSNKTKKEKRHKPYILIAQSDILNYYPTLQPPQIFSSPS